MKKHSLIRQILIPISCILIILSTVLSTVSIYKSKSALRKNTEKFIQEISDQLVENVNKELNDNILSLQGLARSTPVKSNTMSWNVTQNTLQSLKTLRNFDKIGICDLNGIIKYSDETTENVSDKEFFKKALEGKNTVERIEGNGLILVYAVPVYENKENIEDGNIVKLLIGYKSEEPIVNAIDDSTISGEGHAYILDKNGVIVAHKDDNLIGKNNFKYNEGKDGKEELNKVHTKMLNGNKGIDLIKVKGENTYLAYGPISYIDWYLGIYVNEEDVLKEVNSLSGYLVILTIATLIISLAITILIIRKILGNLKQVTSHVEDLSYGNLTIEINEDNLKRKDEIGDIAKAICNTQNSIASVVREIKSNSNSIDDNSQELADISKEVAISTDVIAKSIKEVSEGSIIQAQELEKIVEIVNEFGNGLDDIVRDFNYIFIKTQNIDNKAGDSNESMKRVTEALETLIMSFRDCELKINKMNDNIIKVTDITQLMNEIADQTNLLALNAAIEAASAGEAGRGFAVVADEVKNLAEKSRNASKGIYQIMNTVLKDIENISESTAGMNNELLKQKNKIISSIVSLKDISESVVEINPKVEFVNCSVEGLDAKKNTIVERTENISSISQQISASAEEIAASVQQMAAASKEVSKSSDELNNMTSEMKRTVNKFKV